MAILVDSSVWINYFNGAVTPETDRLDQLLGAQHILVGDLILTEVLRGFKNPRHFEAAQRLLTRSPVIPLVGAAQALQSARNFRLLRSRGVTVRKTIDCLIATWCIDTRTSLLHADRGFDPFVTHLGLGVVEVGD